MDPVSVLAFVLFVGMLGGLLVFHHHKIPVVAAGFVALASVFLYRHAGDVAALLHHFHDPHREHLLINLALLLPGFALVAYYFEHSGASSGAARIFKSDLLVLWVVFWLSTILDNIAAAMIGGTIILARYGKDAPFRMIIGTICASNLGGAGSPVGDTTTVMMYISQDPKISVQEIFQAFAASIPAMILVSLWAARHGVSVPALPEGEEKPEERMRWGMVLSLLAVPGLIVGNLYDQPGLGLWAGLGLGLLLGWTPVNFTEIKKALPNTLFLVTLVATAEMLPLEDAKPMLNTMSRDTVAVLMGLLSAWFDNIPLTAVCLQLKGFDWGLLAYCVGYGGSAMWFGSSAGVAMGLIFPQVYDTKRWGVPFVVITLTYLVGAACYYAVFHGMIPTTSG